MRHLFCTIALLSISVSGAVFANDKFRIEGDVLIYDTEVADLGSEAEITWEDADYLITVLRQNPEITRLNVNSGGGRYYAGLDMGRIVADFELHVHVVDECASSCTYILAGGAKRTLSRGGKVGFHHTSWPAESLESYYEDKRESSGWETPFDFSSWLYRDTQHELYGELSFLLDQGVDPYFALETIRVRGEGLWFPTRKELLEAGFLTE